MLILYNQKDKFGCYPGIQKCDLEKPPSDCLEFPPEKLDVFYPVDKKSGGFVDLMLDGNKIVDVIWNEEAYQAYLASLPEPEEPSEDPNQPATLEDRLTAVEAETAALTAAIERGLAL